MNRLMVWASLLAFVVLSGCSSFSSFDFSPTVDRGGQPVVEGEKRPGQLKPLNHANPVQAALQWTLNYAPLNGADARGLQVAADGQRFYMAMPNGMVTAFHRADQPTWASQVAWQLLLGSPVLAGPLLHDDMLYVGTADGRLLAVEARSGKVRWTRQLSSSLDARLVWADGVVLARTLDSQLYAVRAADGEVSWKAGHEAPALALQGEPAPLVWLDRVIVGWENGLVEALDLGTGNVLWRQRLATPQGRTDLERMVDVQAQPVIRDGRLYVVAFHGKLAAMNPDNGALEWVKDFSGYRDPVVLSDRILVLDDEDMLHAFDLVTGTRIWRQADLKYRQLTDLRLWPETGLVVTGDGQGLVHWIEPLNGQLEGRVRHHSKPIVGLFVLSGNQLVVIDGEGYLSLYRMKRHHE